MAYFGNEPADNFTAITKDTFSGDGSTTAFTLTNPATTNGVQVFVENVRQEPTSAYTVSNTTLTFTAAPVSGTNNIYVVNSGTPVSTATHPAGAALQATTGTFSSDVSTEGDVKLTVSSGGIYTVTGTDTSSDRTLTLPNETGTVLTSGGTSLQEQVSTTQVAFQVSALNHDQAYTSGATLVQWPTVALDSHSYWDGTNYRYTPQIAGWYFFSCTLRFLIGSSPSYYRLTIRKNGSEGDDSLVIQPQFTSGILNNGTYPGPSGMIYLNGSTDYVDVAFESSTSLTLHDSTSQESFFTGFLMRKA